MRKLLLGIAMGAAAGVAPAVDHSQDLPPGIVTRLAARCESCVTVQEVRKEKRASNSGQLGIVAFAGDEIQKLLTGKDVWVTRVRQRDGSERSFEQEHEPNWRPGTIVRIKRNKLVNL